MSTLLRSAVIAGALAAPVVSQAATPTLGDVLKASGVTESGYINATWNYDNRKFSSPSTLSYNDANYDGFTLNQVGLTLSATPSGGFGGVVDILGGADAKAIPSDAGSDIVFKQAYAQYAVGGLTVMGGRFVTLTGAEVIAATGNSNATRSLLFGIQPLTHTGVRAAFKAGNLTFTGGVVNSALNTAGGGTPAIVDNNPQKTIELQGAFATDVVSLALTGYKGTESTTSPSQSPLLIDFVGSLNLMKAISLGLNVDHEDLDDCAGCAAGKTKRDGVALYGNLQATKAVRFGARIEYLKQKGVNDGSSDATRKQKEVTLTGALAATSNFDLVTDVRYDKDDAKAGVLNPVPSAFGGHDSMVTVVLSGIYKF